MQELRLTSIIEKAMLPRTIPSSEQQELENLLTCQQALAVKIFKARRLFKRGRKGEGYMRCYIIPAPHVRHHYRMYCRVVFSQSTRGLDIGVHCRFQVDARVRLIVLSLAPLSTMLNLCQPLPGKGLSLRANCAHQHLAIIFCPYGKASEWD